MKKEKVKLVTTLVIALTLILTINVGSTIAKENKDTLVVADMYAPKTVDPHAAGDSASVNVLNEITETLVEYNSEGEIVPLLAKKWERLDDLTYKFYLRKGVYFHNGEEMTAEDVVFSFKRALSPAGARVQYIMKAVDPEGFEIIDDYTVIIRTKESFSPFISYLPYIGASIINKEYYESEDQKVSMHPVGTGPYKFVEWKHGDKVELERFEDYWGKKPYFENMVIKAMTEANSRAIALETGGVDIAYNITSNHVDRIRENPDVELKRRLSTVFTYLGFNCGKPPLDNMKLRKAIDYAIDEKSIVASVFRGVGVYTPGPVTPEQNYFLEGECKYNPEKAKELLKEIEMDSGLKLSLLVNDRDERIDIAQIVQAQLREVGIEVEINVMEWGAFLDATTSGKQEMFISGWGAVGFPDPDNNLYGPIHSSMIPANNFCFYSDPELDKYLEQSRTLPNGPEREKAVKEAQRLIRERVPYVTFDNSEQIVGVQKNIKGFEPSAASSHKCHDAYYETE